MGFKERLRTYRLKHDMTQAEMAKLINVEQPTVNNYEVGKIRPSKNTAIQIAKVMRIDVDELMRED